MDFMTAVRHCLTNYATFVGRAARSEFWYFTLFMILASAGFTLLDFALFPAMPWSPLNSIFSLLMLLPSIAVAARRLHDIDRSGWWQLILLVPLVGWIVYLIWLCKAGSPGDNRYGASSLPVATLP